MNLAILDAEVDIAWSHLCLVNDRARLCARKLAAGLATTTELTIAVEVVIDARRDYCEIAESFDMAGLAASIEEAEKRAEQPEVDGG